MAVTPATAASLPPEKAQAAIEAHHRKEAAARRGAASGAVAAAKDAVADAGEGGCACREFRMFDVDITGSLDFEEFKQLIVRTEGDNNTDPELRRRFDLIDADGSGPSPKLCGRSAWKSSSAWIFSHSRASFPENSQNAATW